MDACLKKIFIKWRFYGCQFPTWCASVHRCQNLRGAVYSTTVPFLHCQATSTPTTSTGSGSPPTVRKVQLMDHVIAGGGRTACTCCPGPLSSWPMTSDHSGQYSTTTLRKVAVYLQVKLQETFPRGKLDQPHLWWCFVMTMMLGNFRT